MDPSVIVGWSYTISVPDVDDRLAAGFTAIRVYTADSEGGTYTHYESIALVSGTTEYQSTNPTGLASQWAQHSFYGASTGETPRSEPVPLGPYRVTRKTIRQRVGEELMIMTTATRSGTASATTHTFTDLIDADASKSRYANHFLRAVSGATSESRRVRDEANDGYAPATGVITTNAFSAALEPGVECELWMPWNDMDPSVMVDRAINRSRAHIWYEDVHYFSISNDITSYLLPEYLSSLQQVIAVEHCDEDDFPDEPDWRPITSPRIVTQGGQGWIEIDEHLHEGDIIRIRHHRMPARLLADTDYWAIDEERAIAEAKLEFLSGLLEFTGGSFENDLNIQTALERAARTVVAWRGAAPMSPVVQGVIPR